MKLEKFAKIAEIISSVGIVVSLFYAAIQFNENSKLVWKKNYYSKSEKKLKPVLQLANNNKILIEALIWQQLTTLEDIPH